MKAIATIEAQAAEWLARKDAGLSADEEIEFSQWLCADPRRREAYEAVTQTSLLLDRFHSDRDTGRLTAELDRPVRRSGKIVLFATVLATAASVAFAYTTWWRPFHYAKTTSTEIGFIRHLMLPDGSQVNLNTDSHVEILFSPEFRKIRLDRGEALFTVTKDATRPFLVQAGAINVRALGTAFNVRLHSDAIEVLVTEGKVAVASQTQRSTPAGPTLGSSESQPTGPKRKDPLSRGESDLGTIVEAGHRVMIPAILPESPSAAGPVPEASPVAQAQIDRALAWQEKRLVFANTPLSVIVAEFNRYNVRKLRIADAALSDDRFGGTFEANDPTTLVQLLETSFGVVADSRESEIVLRLGAKSGKQM